MGTERSTMELVLHAAELLLLAEYHQLSSSDDRQAMYVLVTEIQERREELAADRRAGVP